MSFCSLVDSLALIGVLRACFARCQGNRGVMDGCMRNSFSYQQQSEGGVEEGLILHPARRFAVASGHFCSTQVTVKFSRNDCGLASGFPSKFTHVSVPGTQDSSQALCSKFCLIVVSDGSAGLGARQRYSTTEDQFLFRWTMR